MIKFPAIDSSNGRVPQSITDVVSGVSATYTFIFRWNARDSSWYFDVVDDDQTVIAAGIRIVLGAYLGRRVQHDLFRNGVFIAIDTSGQKVDAGLGDFGTRVQLRYYDVVEASLLKSGAPVVQRPGLT